MLQAVGPYVARETALGAGLKRYFPGTACPRGHRSPRIASNSACTACRAEKRGENRDAINAAQREYYKADPTRFNGSAKRYAEANKDRVNAIKRKYAVRHPEKIKDAKRRWAQANPGKILEKENRRRAALRRATPHSLKRNDMIYRHPNWAALIERSDLIEVGPRLPNGIRVSGLHVIGNLRYLPGVENSRRGTKISQAELAMLETV